MDTADLIGALRREGELLADLAVRAGHDAEVPTCPGWRVRDLLAHTGSVHRWAAGYVAGLTRPTAVEPCAPKDSASLDGWFRDGHRELVDRLATAPSDLECWTFLPAPTPLAFWARRQAHETAVHRLDAESAVGAEPAAFTAVFARDGIDELLTGLHARERSRVRTREPRTLLVETAADAPDPAGPNAWLLHLSARPPHAERLVRAGGVRADCTVRGSSGALYRALWNRGGHEELAVTGDASLVALWRSHSSI